MSQPIFTEFSKLYAIFPAPIVKIRDFLTNTDSIAIGIGHYEVSTSQVYDIRVATIGNHVGRNMINEVQKWRRIAIATPNFGVLGMLGIYAVCGNIYEIVATSRPEAIRKIAKFCGK